ncbi:MAG: S41 family peptidase, partial [Chitinophagaceae bacterium]
MRRIIAKRSKVVQYFIIAALIYIIPGCEKALELKKPKSGAVDVFNEVWTVMDERYSMFGIKNVDWKSVYAEYQAKVNDEMSDVDLFHVLGAMLEKLKDGHIVLSSSNDKTGYDAFYKAFAPNFNYTNVLNNYLKNDYTTTGPFIYKVVDSVGYIYYKSFQDEISDQLLDNLIGDMLRNTKAVIIDVRDNTGGNSLNATKIFSHFISEKRLVKYEWIKNGTGHNDFATPEPFYISPAGQIYKKPIAVLTNRKCFSTCNDFVLFMSDLPNVKQYGDQTGGGGG